MICGIIIMVALLNRTIVGKVILIAHIKQNADYTDAS